MCILGLEIDFFKKQNTLEAAKIIIPDLFSAVAVAVAMHLFTK